MLIDYENQMKYFSLLRKMHRTKQSEVTVKAAANLDFEKAIELREKIKEIKDE